MTSHFTDISVSARSSALSSLLASVSEQAASLGVTAEDSLRLQLVVEELFINTITHGHQGDSDHKVGVVLRHENPALSLRYEDDAPPFDTSKIGQNSRSTAEVGGQGLALIHGMSKATHYQRQGQRNITKIEF
ncbi:MAG: ATP-binding protein [Dechloromonas sp.]|nr:ATP-binding protein [Dechloromonas sp.]